MRHKVTVVGAGNVGATCALYIAQQELADVVLIDILEGVPQGKALDITQTGPIQGFDSVVTGTNDYADTKDSDVVVITAGLARKPGMDRLDLLKKNADIVANITTETVKYSPNAIFIMVTNPIDVMVYHCWKLSGLSHERVVGQAGILDTARYSAFIAMELGVSPKNVNAMILGGHGDSMVPVPDYSTVSGIPITKLIADDRIKAISDRARVGGGEIVKLLGTGSAYYAPAAASVRMVEAVLHDSGMVLPCSCYLTGQYGINDLYVGVPCKLGRNGVREVVEVDLNPVDRESILNSAKIYRQSIDELYGS